MFYFDETIKEFEKAYLWDNALSYLEELFEKRPSVEILNSLVGYSWFYLIEGPIESGTYEKDPSVLPLPMWEKYLKIGKECFATNASFSFIAGYTLLLHGFHIKEYEKTSELIGKKLLLQAQKTADNPPLKELVDLILSRSEQKKYVQKKLKREVIEQLFINDSLLENYFKEVFCH